jgi:hypothetical protein
VKEHTSVVKVTKFVIKFFQQSFLQHKFTPSVKLSTIISQDFIRKATDQEAINSGPWKAMLGQLNSKREKTCYPSSRLY